MNKPFSQACENNKQPILEVIQQYFTRGTILEIGSGTGQHAVYFAAKLNNILWQTSDRVQYHNGIKQWLADYPNDNLAQPLELDVNQSAWPLTSCDGVFSANTAHIMDWNSVTQMFTGVARILTLGGYFCLYGPVNINSQFTSDSNQAFDMKLRTEDPSMGIRDLEQLQKQADSHGLVFTELHQMPANNVLMVWQKTS